MNDDSCVQLDDFLALDLPSEQRAVFLAHLDDCASCRRRVEEDRGLDALLKLAVEQQPIPARLLQKVDRLRHNQLRRVVRRTTAVAALLMLCLSTTWLLKRSDPTAPPRLTVTSARDRAPPKMRAKKNDTPQKFQVRVTPLDDAIAIPVKTSNPNVTMVWIHASVPTRSSESKVHQVFQSVSVLIERSQ